MKGQDPLQFVVPSSCWSLKKIFKSQEFILQIGGWTKAVAKGKYSISIVYRNLQDDFPKVSWRRVLCYNKASPRSIFITWLAILNRLYTTDRMQTWEIGCSDDCVLCSGGKESVEHLLFSCSFSTAVWQAVLKKLGINRGSAGLTYELGKQLS
ncbi:uncharacterized protein [Spinacia oleracea]|uniref:Reverse transcriptase zinc-binding domain-containing protein n=1 Tax=Spinacia oleracea TaxID=3562 RepID=A0ABM3RSP8_SPIOL|nr:uncharacterized protein LOC130472177 [Spinacia oleracea]